MLRKVKSEKLMIIIKFILFILYNIIFLIRNLYNFIIKKLKYVILVNID